MILPELTTRDAWEQHRRARRGAAAMILPEPTPRHAWELRLELDEEPLP